MVCVEMYTYVVTDGWVEGVVFLFCPEFARLHSGEALCCELFERVISVSRLLVVCVLIDSMWCAVNVNV